MRFFGAEHNILFTIKFFYFEKHSSLSLSAKFNFAYLLMILCLSFVWSFRVNAQSIECGVDIPASWNQKLIEEAELIKGYVGSTENPRVVPVKFIQFLPQNLPSGVSMLTQGEAEQGVAYLNAAFTGSGISFELCGPIQYLLDNNSSGGSTNYFFNFQRYIPFEHSTGVMNVFIVGTLSNNLAWPPCPYAFQGGNPVYNATCPAPDTYVYLQGPTLVTHSTFPHEVGHHLGLLHTQHPHNIYISPPTNTQGDRPYLVLNNAAATQPQDPNWYARELVIRSDAEFKDFKVPNAAFSGDLVSDTPADCASFTSNQLFPGCPMAAQNGNTCELDPNLLTYKDYNGDAIYPPPAGLELGRNYMSYWDADCVNKFTEGQFERARFMYDNYRKPSYGTCGSFAGDVSFWNTGTKIPNVTIRIEQNFSGSQFRKTNTTTNGSGEFSSIIFDGPVFANVYHNGQESFFKYTLADNRVHFDHKHCEWVQGVDAQDLYLIGQHINGSIPFDNGYQKIAGDANKSGIVSSFDIVLLRRLLMPASNPLSILTLPGQDQIFRFVPEYIPQNFAAGFNTNPFNMGGVFPSTNNLNCTLLTEAANLSAISVSPFGFNIPNIQGQQGFDAVKIGDVDGSWTPSTCNDIIINVPSEVSLLKQPNISLAANQEAVLTFASKNFSQATAFSLGISIPDSYFEIVEVKSQTLADLDPIESFGLNTTDGGSVSVIWAELTQLNRTLLDGTGLFSIKVKAKQPITDVTGIINLDNAIMKNKIWQSSGNGVNEIHLFAEPIIGERNNEGDTNINTNIRQVLECMPNPTNGSVQIKFNSATYIPTASIGVFDLKGQLLYEQTTSLQQGTNTIDTDAFVALPAGTYQIQLITGGRVYSTKIIRK